MLTPRQNKRSSGSLLTPEKSERSDHHLLRADSDSKSSHSRKSKHLETSTSSDAELMLGERILRDFDLELTYGPCCIVSRRERYDRALRLGLCPPSEIVSLIEKTGNNESVLDVHMRQVSS